VFTLGNDMNLFPYIETYYWNVLNSFIPVKIRVDGFRSSPFGLRPHKQGSLLRLSGYAGQAGFTVQGSLVAKSSKSKITLYRQFIYALNKVGKKKTLV
jgi:hypothetical protein